MYYVYILQGRTHYIGYTSDLVARLHKHRQGSTYTTRRLGDFVCLGYFLKSTKHEAMKLEKIIKRDGHINHRLTHPTFIKHQ